MADGTASGGPVPPPAPQPSPPPGGPTGGYGYPNPAPGGAPGGPGGYGYPDPAPGGGPASGYGYPNPAPGPPPGGTAGGGYGYPNPGRPGGPAAAPMPDQAPFGQGYDPNATAGQAELCPQCRTPRRAQAPFCEECLYNFLAPTAPSAAPGSPHGAPGQPGGQQPPPQAPHQPQQPPPQTQQQSHLPSSFFQSQAPQPQSPQTPQAPQPPQQTHPPQGLDYQSSRPSQVNRPAEPLAPPPPPPYSQQPPGPPAEPDFRRADDWTLPPPSQAAAGAPGQAPATGHNPGVPPAGAAETAGWVALVAPDREYFTAMMGRSGPEAAALSLPAYSDAQEHPLTGGQVTIGRRRPSTGESPDIDLSRPPEDPGVSHQHAMLVAQPDGSWSVVDQDSTNGTTVNGGENPIQPFVPVPLGDGDRVHVGAWTTITVRRG